MNLARQLAGRFVRDERGAAMVEFAVVAVVFFIPLIFGIIEFGRMAWTKSTLTAAAREGVRYAIVHGSVSATPADSAAIANYVIGRTQLGGISVRPLWTDGNDGGTTGNDPGDIVQVTVNYSYNSLIPIIQSRTLYGRSRQIISY
jgi:Flp pilus assembly protein TadG